MIPLLILTMGLGAFVLTYEFSPKVHEWVDEHVRALRALFAAIHAANAHVAAARSSTDPATAAEHTRQAEAAKREAAREAAIAADKAQTEKQRAAAAQGAAAVDQTGAAIAALGQLVSSASAWVDEHTRALTGALAAHSAADVNLAAVHAAPDSATAVTHATAANNANRAAADETAVAVATAKTEPQRTAAAQSAGNVVDRDKKITSVFASLGLGVCDVQSYPGITSKIKDTLINKLHAAGMAVTGNNPWDIDTNKLGVVLRAAWDSRSQELKLIVKANPGGKDLCPLIWAQVNPILKEVTGK